MGWTMPRQELQGRSQKCRGRDQRSSGRKRSPGARHLLPAQRHAVVFTAGLFLGVAAMTGFEESVAHKEPAAARALAREALGMQTRRCRSAAVLAGQREYDVASDLLSARLPVHGTIVDVPQTAVNCDRGSGNQVLERLEAVGRLGLELRSPERPVSRRQLSDVVRGPPVTEGETRPCVGECAPRMLGFTSARNLRPWRGCGNRLRRPEPGPRFSDSRPGTRPRSQGQDPSIPPPR